MHLYHVSEEAGIREFVPRPEANPDSGVTGEAVWAISQKELANYLLPRECPRVCYRNEFGEKIIAVEEGWMDAIQSTQLYIYHFEPHSFVEQNPIAGYWLSRSPVVPIKMQVIESPLLELAKRNLTLKILPHLHSEKEQVLNNYEHFSIIRFRNACAAN